MRRFVALLVVCMLTVMVPVSAQSQSAPVLSEIHPAPAEGGREFVEIWNPDSSSIDLAGWQIVDEAANTFTFPSWELAADARVVVWGGGEGNAYGPAWTKSTVWNNGGDTVTLLAPDATVTDSLAYGSATNATIGAPATGESLHLRGGTWDLGAPSPGYVEEVQGGDVGATVAEVAPDAAFTQAPVRVHRGDSVDLQFDVHDDNGDLATWSIESDGTILANGTASGIQEVQLSAPSVSGMWILSLVATDAGGRDGSDAALIRVAASDIEVHIPAGGIDFPLLAPGATEVTAPQTFTIENVGTNPVTPVFDISDFTGPATIPVDDNLRIGVDDGISTTWVEYTGPLTELPTLGSGQQREITLQITAVPTPLAGGAYSTSFTVIG